MTVDFLQDVVQPVVVVLLGLVLGSFLLTVIDRNHAGDSWIRGRSRCDKCKKEIAWFDLIPIVSYVLLRGRCRSCGSKYAAWHVVSELLLGGLFALVYFVPFGIGPDTLLARMTIVAALFFLFIYDVRHGELPDVFVLPLILLAGVWAYLSGAPLLPTLGAAIIGSGLFLIQWAVSKGRWVGTGDIRLGFLLGLLVGWPGILLVLFVAYVGGSLIALMLIGFRILTAKDTVPMAAFLVPATLLILWAGPQLLEFVRSLAVV